MHVHVTIEQKAPEPEPEPGLWQRIRDLIEPQLRPWQTLTAATAALLPLFSGESAATLWSAAMADCRTEATIGAAYLLAGIAVLTTGFLDHRTGRWLPRALTITTLVGGFGALDWFDPITLVTGVTR